MARWPPVRWRIRFGVVFGFADDFLAEDGFDAERDVRAFFADERRCEPAAGEASERVRASELSEGSPADGTKATNDSSATALAAPCAAAAEGCQPPRPRARRPR